MDRLGDLHIAVFSLPIVYHLRLTKGCYGKGSLQDDGRVYLGFPESRQGMLRSLLGQLSPVGVGILIAPRPLQQALDGGDCGLDPVCLPVPTQP